MAVANPLALLWGLLAVPIVVLYRRRIRPAREPVATSMLWQRVLAEQPARSSWQRWRRPASLAIQLAVLALIVVALADPRIPGPRRTVLIIDDSASMNAADAGPTRLAKARHDPPRTRTRLVEAKRIAKALIAGLRACDQAAILSAGGAVGVHCTLTSDRRRLHDALEAVPATQGSTQVHTAVALGRWILADQPRGGITVLSDGCFDGAAELDAAGDVEIIRVGRRTGNLAVTGLQVRRTIPEPQRCQVLVEVSNFSDKPVEGRLELMLDSRPLEAVPVALSGQGRWQHVFEKTLANAGWLTARLEPGDAYPDDNEASGRVPPVEGGQRGAGPPIDFDARWLAAGQARVRESDLRVPRGLATGAARPAERRPGRLTDGRVAPQPAHSEGHGTCPSDGRPWRLLVVAGLLLLTSQWCFYQRRWIC